MFETVYSVAPLVACCIVLALAIWIGGPTEQAASGLTALAWAAYLVVHALVERYAWGQLAIDVGLLVSFGVILWRSSREWTLGALAFQGVAVAVDVWYLFDHSVPPSTYTAAQALSSLGVLLSILFGVFETARRKPKTTPTP